MVVTAIVSDCVLVCALIPAITFVIGMLYGRYVLLAGQGKDIDPDLINDKDSNKDDEVSNK